MGIFLSDCLFVCCYYLADTSEVLFIRYSSGIVENIIISGDNQTQQLTRPRRRQLTATLAN